MVGVLWFVTYGQLVSAHASEGDLALSSHMHRYTQEGTVGHFGEVTSVYPVASVHSPSAQLTRGA